MNITPQIQAIIEFYKSIEPSITSLRKAITAYYRANGVENFGCGVSVSADPPAIGFDFIPEVCRERLAELIEAAGIGLRRYDGGKGQSAYFLLLRETIIEERLQALTAAVEVEVRWQNDSGERAVANTPHTCYPILRSQRPRQ